LTIVKNLHQNKETDDCAHSHYGKAQSSVNFYMEVLRQQNSRNLSRLVDR